jgi:hypothetical protein
MYASSLEWAVVQPRELPKSADSLTNLVWNSLASEIAADPAMQPGRYFMHRNDAHYHSTDSILVRGPRPVEANAIGIAESSFN